MKKFLRLVGSIALMLCVGLSILAAQEEAPEDSPYPDTGVWVTTQLNSRLRAGPGQGFDTITILPYATTLPAIGRSAGGTWVQVVHEGEPGWIAARLLVWTGPFFDLPIDGIEPEPFIRRAGVQAVTVRDTPYYNRWIAESDLVGYIPAGTRVELVARLGSRGYRPVQVTYNGGSYWVGTWNLRIVSGRIDDVFDISYIYAYGRLVTQLSTDIRDGGIRLSEIETIWLGLQRGEAVQCNSRPLFLENRQLPESDLREEPIFVPVTVALEEARLQTNNAISLFEDACNRADRYITESDVRAGIEAVNAANRNFNLAVSLLAALRVRDPFNAGQ